MYLCIYTYIEACRCSKSLKLRAGWAHHQTSAYPGPLALPLDLSSPFLLLSNTAQTQVQRNPEVLHQTLLSHCQEGKAPSTEHGRLRVTQTASKSSRSLQHFLEVLVRYLTSWVAKGNSHHPEKKGNFFHSTMFEVCS